MSKLLTQILLSTGLLFSAVTTAVLPTIANAEDSKLWLDIELGKSKVVETSSNTRAVAVTDPNIANIVVLSPTKIQIQGLAVGTTDLTLHQSGSEQTYEIVVHRDLSDLIRRVDEITEGEPPNVYPLDQRIVVEGPVDDLETLERIASVSQIYDKEFINLMTVRGDQQVQLEVMFAEVSRTALRELGINVLWGDSKMGFGMSGPNPGGAGSVLNPSNLINGGVALPSDVGVVNLLGYVGAIDLAAVISALDEHRLSKMLAQPTLVALSGQQAEFLSGGEIPIAVPSGRDTIAIEWKEYGVKLQFTPTVLGGDVIDVRVYLEVSELDYTRGIRIAAVELPGLSSRKAKSHLRVGNGMTFAMAGLLSETTRSSKAQLPFLGQIPIVGTLFRYTRHQKEETELMIFVTPRLVRPLAAGEVPAVPGATEDMNPNDFELFFLGMSHHAGSRTAEPTKAVGLQR